MEAPWEALRADSEHYYTRNQGLHELPVDPLEGTISRINNYAPIESVLEIGAGNGWRLRKLRERYDCKVAGLDSSKQACGESDGLVRYGLAPWDTTLFAGPWDLVILGFFTYLLPRSGLRRLVSEVDRLLVPGGHVVVLDFLYPRPVRVPYTHDEALTVYKHDVSALFTAGPEYVLVDRQLTEHSAHHVDNSDPAKWIVADAVMKLSPELAYGGQ
jgi:SAM-dependent methyltransferase